MDCNLRLNKKNFLVGLSVSLAYAFVTYAMSAHLYGWGGSDIQVHTNAIIETWFSEGFFSFFERLPYFGWHLVAWIFLSLGIAPLVAASLADAVFNFATAWLTLFVVKRITGGKPSICILVSFVVLFVSAIWVPFFNPEVYLGQGSPNVWNNPTYFAVRPFALLTTYLFIDSSKDGFSDFKKSCVLGILVLVGIVAKPTYFQALLPAAFLFFVIGKISQAPWGSSNWKNVTVVFLPAVLFAIVEFAILFFIPSPSAESNNGGGFAITLFEGWSKYTPNPVVSIVLLLAFPLYNAYVCREKFISAKSPYLILLLMLCVSLLEVLLIVETGAREGHGNFAWALYGSVFLFWVFGLSGYAKKWLNGGLLFNQKAIGAVLIAGHLISGLYYFLHLLLTTAPY